MSPYVALGAGVFYLASVTGAAFYGAHTEKNAIEAKQKEAVEQAVKDAQENAAIDYSAQQELALEKQKSELLKQQHTRTVYKTVSADKGAADCRLNAQSYSVLRDSLNAANGADGPASASDSAVRNSNDPGRFQPSSDDIRARLNGVDPQRLQGQPQSAR
jgi:hypothetical protein